MRAHQKAGINITRVCNLLSQHYTLLNLTPWPFKIASLNLKLILSCGSSVIFPHSLSASVSKQIIVDPSSFKCARMQPISGALPKLGRWEEKKAQQRFAGVFFFLSSLASSDPELLERWQGHPASRNIKKLCAGFTQQGDALRGGNADQALPLGESANRTGWLLKKNKVSLMRNDI